MIVTLLSAAAVLAAGAAAGLVNAVAGGGTLISFPMLVTLGLPPLTANMTNNVASCAGYLGGAFAQRHEFARFGRGFLPLLAAIALGGIVGAAVLLATPARLFGAIIPYLILLAALLLALQPLISQALGRRQQQLHAVHQRGAVFALFACGIYGGYFGAGLSIMLLAVLAFSMSQSLITLNALKQLLSLVNCSVSALIFIARAPIDFRLVAAMAAGFLIGGNIGGRIAGRLSPKMLRGVVVTFGLAMVLKFWLI